VKAAHSKHHWQLEFNVGNWAWLHLNQHTAVSVREGPLSKLAPKYFGPYHVIKQLDEVAYRLQLPPKARIHNVFHVAFLKKFDGVALVTIRPLPPIVRERTVPLPQEVVRAKPTTNSLDLLVKWEGRALVEATWEQLEAFKEAYPEFQLEDKLFHQEGGMLWTLTSISSIEGGRKTSWRLVSLAVAKCWASRVSLGLKPA
jgi:hypothetical protein